MRLAALLLLVASPAWAQFPPEREPLTDPFRVLEAVGMLAFDEPQDASGRIDVLFAFSPAVWASCGGETVCRAFAQQVADQWNQAAVNEELVTSKRVCGVMPTTYVEGQGSFPESPLSWMATSGATGGRDQLWAELTRLGCDLGHMVTLNNACGQGYLQTSALNPWSMSHRDCAVGNMSSIHEVGHNVGLHHDPPSSCGQPTCSGYNYGHAWPVAGPQERDPMAYPAAGGSRVLWWSSPLVTRLGEPIGLANQRDNARVLRERAAIVAGFRTATTGVPAPRATGKPILTED